MSYIDKKNGLFYTRRDFILSLKHYGVEFMWLDIKVTRF